MRVYSYQADERSLGCGIGYVGEIAFGMQEA